MLVCLCMWIGIPLYTCMVNGCMLICLFIRKCWSLLLCMLASTVCLYKFVIWFECLLSLLQFDYFSAFAIFSDKVLFMKILFPLNCKYLMSLKHIYYVFIASMQMFQCLLELYHLIIQVCSCLFRETHNIFEKKNVDIFPITYIYLCKFHKIN